MAITVEKVGNKIATVFLGLALLIEVVSATAAYAATDPGDVYKGAYWLLQQADIARDDGHSVEARASYLSALNIYQAISRQFPAWEKDLVRFRMAYCREQASALSAVPSSSTFIEDTLPEGTGLDMDALLRHAHDMCVSGSTGELKQAEAVLVDVIRTSPSNRLARTLMAITQLQLGRAEDSAALLRALSQEKTPLVEIWLSLAGAEWAVGDWAAARKALDQAMMLEPDTPAVHYNMAQLYLHTASPDVEGASAEYLKFLSLGGSKDSDVERRLQR